ncbi:MAG TPA: P-loop NTPase, partial [Roseococcus sp.]|nr:P-loop NTPase [Roseococcus sp.]
MLRNDFMRNDLLQTNPRATPPMVGALHPVRVMAITGGKGGVGKTNLSVNLAVAFAEMGKRTLLMDADLGLANIDVLLGLAPKFTLADLVAG